MAFDVDPAHLEPSTQEALARLLRAWSNAGIAVRIRSGKRTCAVQNGLYAIGRDGDTRTPVTNARGCLSWHVLGRAVDVDPLAGGSYDAMAAIAEPLGWKWGGRFLVGGTPDVGHFEWHPGMTIEQACPDPSACNDALPTPASGSGFGRGVAFLLAVAIGYGATYTALR